MCKSKIMGGTKVKKILELLKCNVNKREIKQINFENDNIDGLLVDVRSRQEYEEGHLRGAINIPLGSIDENILGKIPKDKNIIIYCQSGMRSKKACEILDELGYEKIYNLEGGLNNK